MKKALLSFSLLTAVSQGATIVASADANIQKGTGSDATANANFGGNGLLVVKDGNSSVTRKIYLLFDLSSITSTITQASLDLTIGSNDGGLDKILEIVTPNIQTATFAENTITWVNAPNHNTGSNAFTDTTTLFSSQTVLTTRPVGTILSYSNQALVDYINTEVATGNKEAMIMIRRTDTNTTPNFSFYSKDNAAVNGTTIIAPTLNYTLVPEPSALLLSALGSLALLRRKR